MPEVGASGRLLDAWRSSSPLVAWAALGVALAGTAWGVHAAGGTRSAVPHLFYLVIIAGAARFARRGGIVTALVATLLCGPLMPLDVASGASQPLVNWLSRGLFFILVGALVGSLVHAVGRAYQLQVARHVERELDIDIDLTDDVAGAGPGSPRHPAGQLPTRSEVAEVLTRRRFHVVFQPIYSLHDGRLRAVEALARFDGDPSRPPNVWFAAAARAGLGVELELAAIESAFSHAALVPDDVALSVNCSPQALADPRLPAFFLTQRPRPVILELTEHAIVDDYQLLDAAIARLRSWGAKLAIDDAGAGFASLRHIVRLAPEIIKLDISLTQNLRHDPVRRALADCLIRFARETGSELIAEGIEHDHDLDTWIDLGADAVQGYHLARPGPLPADSRCQRLGGRQAMTGPAR